MGSIWLMIWIYATVTSNRFVERWIYEVETTVTFLNQMDNFHLIIPHFSLKCALKSFFLRLGKILHSWKALDLKSKQERFPSYSNLHIQLIYSSDALTTKFKVMYTNFHNNTINWQFRCFFTIENQHYFSQVAPALAPAPRCRSFLNEWQLEQLSFVEAVNWRFALQFARGLSVHSTNL